MSNVFGVSNCWIDHYLRLSNYHVTKQSLNKALTIDTVNLSPNDTVLIGKPASSFNTLTCSWNKKVKGGANRQQNTWLELEKS